MAARPAMIQERKAICAMRQNHGREDKLFARSCRVLPGTGAVLHALLDADDGKRHQAEHDAAARKKPAVPSMIRSSLVDEAEFDAKPT